MKKYYIMTTSKDRIGWSHERWYVGEFKTKKAARERFSGRFYGTVKYVLTEEQLKEYGWFEQVSKEATTW